MMLLACALTVMAETVFFLAAGERDRVFLLMCVCANVITNLTLNLLVVGLYRFGVDVTLAVYPLEAAAVAAEFLLYSKIKGGSARLMLLTLAANTISYCTGLAIFGHV